MKTAQIRNLKLKQAKKAEAKKDGYTHGFVKKCTERGVDPLKLVEIIDTLDLHL